jgi:hypothetical protein
MATAADSSSSVATRAKPESANGRWNPESEAERNAIRQQLDRILTSPLFKNSKRYPNLLRFVVERSLKGHTDPLKERTLGIEVFGRDPDYDTNADPVVRTTAVEIRKRIAQYYHEPEHEEEIRIDFPPGSYLPEFRRPQKPSLTIRPETGAETAPPAAPAPTPALGIVLEPPVRKQTLHTRKVMLAAVMSAAALAAGVVLLVARETRPATVLDRFWEPVLSSPDPVSVYIGGYTGQTPVSLLDLQNSEKVAYSDATALARVVSLLATRHHSYRIRLQSSSKPEDLIDGSAILIGAFNNTFVLRLTSQLRFGFMRNPDTHTSWIEDRQNPHSIAWSHVMTDPYINVTNDYAIVSRAFDPLTGRVVVTASGLAKFGTEAAGEFLTDGSYLEEISRSAPRGWEHKNMQIVIGANTVGRRAGPPRVVATYFW